MFLTIKNLAEKKLIGQFQSMSFTNNKTYELWSQFMPLKKQIKNIIGSDLFSLEIYPDHYFDSFNPENNFIKWAAVEVTDFNDIPDEMNTLIIPTGLYAVFIHKGPASEGHKTYEYIFREWLPNSEYLIDNRPHFAWMGENYKHEDLESEEEIWIPVRKVNSEQ